MANIRKTIFSLVIGCLCLAIAHGQSTIPATGGNASGAGGSLSYSVGQIVYTTNVGTTGSLAQGVQQPYEISVPTALENTEGITLEYKVYPNPTKGMLTLSLKPFDSDNFRFKLFDINGLLLQEKKVESEITYISMDSYNPSIYFLRIIKDNLEVKVFKIIKN
jgi:hypothetical protein